MNLCLEATFESRFRRQSPLPQLYYIVIALSITITKLTFYNFHNHQILYQLLTLTITNRCPFKYFFLVRYFHRCSTHRPMGGNDYLIVCLNDISTFPAIFWNVFQIFDKFKATNNVFYQQFSVVLGFFHLNPKLFRIRMRLVALTSPWNFKKTVQFQGSSIAGLLLKCYIYSLF